MITVAVIGGYWEPNLMWNVAVFSEFTIKTVCDITNDVLNKGLRHMDRGRYMRTEKQLKLLIPRYLPSQTKHYIYNYIGLEMLEAVLLVQTKEQS